MRGGLYLLLKELWCATRRKLRGPFIGGTARCKNSIRVLVQTIGDKIHDPEGRFVGFCGELEDTIGMLLRGGRMGKGDLIYIENWDVPIKKAIK